MWLVLIEWDGNQPPTTYYTALHNLTLRVRGDKEFEPIVRRAGEYNKAVIVQEGAVLVPSESLARQVAHIAEQEGARSVMTGSVELNDNTNRNLTPNELEVIQRFNETFKKRGRPSTWETEDKDWVITCPECVRTSIITARKVIQCPRCGGLRVSARVGYRAATHCPHNFEEWGLTRWMQGQFEIPPYQDNGVIPKSVTIKGMDKSVINILRKQAWANTTKDWDLLDMVFCARRYYTYKDRQQARMSCCIQLYEAGLTPDDVSIFEKEDIYEPVDAAIYFMGDYDRLIQWYLKADEHPLVKKGA